MTKGPSVMAIKIYNHLPLEIRSLSRTTTFKKQLKKWLVNHIVEGVNHSLIKIIANHCNIIQRNSSKVDLVRNMFHTEDFNKAAQFYINLRQHSVDIINDLVLLDSVGCSQCSEEYVGYWNLLFGDVIS
ncbi:hypothetical protein O3M35_011131 [Rhynocoris fuscipes]|uniref:Uncharacterized protein n=1 Tax=Rhynocoris fuscipes TaxID=488301 RepID=A0AAW1CU01_9HEMI